MKESYKKIDAHGHFGPSFLGPESNIEDYIGEARKIGVVATIASPGPTPEITRGNEIYHPCLWSVSENGVSYFQQLSRNGQVVAKADALPNPYHDVNIDLLNKTRAPIGGIQILVMPIHHPILDTPEEVRSMLFEHPSIAMKLHGISTFSGPENVSESTIDSLRKADKPLVVHTDLYTAEVKSPIHAAYQLNDPLQWVLWARQTGVKTLITHGARLSENAINLAISTPNVMIGIAPDLLLMTEPERLAVATNDYLETLLTMVPPYKLMFDIDFGWNVSERNQWETLDWKMHERMESVCSRIGLSVKTLENVFYNNAVKFYNL